MAQGEKSAGTGIKITLQKIDSQILKINKEISDNSLIILSLKNQLAKLQNMFNTRYDEIQRNTAIDVEKFEEEIQRSYKNHNNSRKLLEKKVKDIEGSQMELAQNLFQVQKKVQALEQSLG